MTSVPARPRVKDPFCAWSHYFGAGLALVGIIPVAFLVRDNGIALLAVAIYGISLVALYLASAVYHTLHVWEDALRKLDHVAIYLLIAGTYAPLCLVALAGPVGWTMLLGQVALAVVGIGLVLVFDGRPTWMRLGICLAMGWMAALAFRPIGAALSAPATAWLIAGGIIYTLGCVVYALRWPNFKKVRFGYHDIWHLFVLAGSICHYIFVLYTVGLIR